MRLRLFFYLIIILSIITTVDSSLAVFLSQEFNYDKKIIFTSRADGDWYLIVLPDRILRVDINGTVKKLKELFEGDTCFASPLGKCYVIYNRVSGKLELYNVENAIPLYSTVSSDTFFVVPDSGSYLIGYTPSNIGPTKVHFYDSDGMITKTLEYDTFRKVISNLSGFILFDCGKNGLTIIDTVGNEIADIPNYSTVALKDNGDSFACSDGEFIYFYMREYMDYKYQINVENPIGMKYSTDGTYFAIWNREKIVSIDATNYLERWTHEITDPTIVVTDVAIANGGNEIFCGVVRDLGENLLEEMRFVEPNLFVLDNRGYQRERDIMTTYYIISGYPKLWCSGDGSILTVLMPKDFYIFKD
ncbi:MAG: hypothetical protein ACUVWP_04735 [bacterium]